MAVDELYLCSHFGGCCFLCSSSQSLNGTSIMVLIVLRSRRLLYSLVVLWIWVKNHRLIWNANLVFPNHILFILFTIIVYVWVSARACSLPFPPRVPRIQLRSPDSHSKGRADSLTCLLLCNKVSCSPGWPQTGGAKDDLELLVLLILLPLEGRDCIVRTTITSFLGNVSEIFVLSCKLSSQKLWPAW